jgi:hypothetical protein
MSDLSVITRPDLDPPLAREPMPAVRHADAPARRSRCPECGYLREGLAAASSCPECGWDPAEPERVSRPTDDAAGWSRAVTLGLVLLLSGTITLLTVTLLMRFRGAWGGSLPVVNFPGPKIWAAALVQRTVGNMPGPIGVSGTVTALQGIVALWLITSPRPVDILGERWLSLRRLTRWIGIGLFGAAFGLVASESHVAWWGNDEREAYFVLLVGAVELPATMLLYLYLRHLAADAGDRRTFNMLSTVAVGVPLVIGAATVMLLIGRSELAGTPNLSHQIFIALYGAVAVGIAMLAVASIGRLIVLHAGLGFAGGATTASAGLAFIASTLRRLTRGFAGDLPRWTCIVGLIVLLGLTFTNVTQIAWLRPRASVLDDLPFFNFLGPKVLGGFIAGEHDSYGWYRWHGHRPTLVWAILAIWAVTTLRVAGEGRWSLRRITRVWATLSIGGMLGLAFAMGPLHNDANLSLSQQSKFLLLATLVVEIPGTLLLYLHLAHLARSRGGPAIGRALVWSGIFATTLMLVAVWAGAMTDASDRAWISWRDTPAYWLTAAAYGALAVTAAAFATWQILRLLGLLVRSGANPTEGPGNQKSARNLELQTQG